jgi:hypothetical protein
MTDPIKIILKKSCPHCNKEILVEVESSVPVIKSILTKEDIAAAKEEAVKELNTILDGGDFDEKIIKDAINWIKEEDTIFGPDDIKTVINSVIN